MIRCLTKLSASSAALDLALISGPQDESGISRVDRSLWSAQPRIRENQQSMPVMPSSFQNSSPRDYSSSSGHSFSHSLSAHGSEVGLGGGVQSRPPRTPGSSPREIGTPSSQVSEASPEVPIERFRQASLSFRNSPSRHLPKGNHEPNRLDQYDGPDNPQEHPLVLPINPPAQIPSSCTAYPLTLPVANLCGHHGMYNVTNVYHAAPYGAYAPYGSQSGGTQLNEALRQPVPNAVGRAPAKRVSEGEPSRYANVKLETLRNDIYTLCKDQHGCRFLQRKLEEYNQKNTAIIFSETYIHVVDLMTGMMTADSYSM